MKQHMPYSPAKRNYPTLPSELAAQLKLVQPVTDPTTGIQYYPCAVELSTGETVDCVYLVEADAYIHTWGFWPEDSSGTQMPIDLSSVVRVFESPHRLPRVIAQKLYDGGESAMGGIIFELEFTDGSVQTYEAGNVVDFVPLPKGQGINDIKEVHPHSGRNDPNRLEVLPHHWCFYSK
jgi:hypothetical protein